MILSIVKHEYAITALLELVTEHEPKLAVFHLSRQFLSTWR
ncbi:Cys regulon transcriptional activator CysB [Vibrio variabilis]|uniref:Cys regulon transcriptional activator CysB n=1 Tax=Vibrio variabilis TaxID=990271 RepID=A0ABQ0JNG5_9VIBR|nr:Cys regulon transcriptional activator CysB [Vibrio variabilis]